MSAVITPFMEANTLLDELGDLLETGPADTETDSAFLVRVNTKYTELGNALQRIQPTDIESEFFDDDNDDDER